MIAQVQVTEDGAVTAVLDTDGAEVEDDDAAKLAGLEADDLLARVALAAIATWREIHGIDDGTPE